MKAKAILKVIAAILGGLVISLVLLTLLILTVFLVGNSPKHSEWQIVRAFTKREAEFETVRQHIDDTDFSAYASYPDSPSYVTIYRSETLPDSMIYSKRINAQEGHLVEIEDDAVNQALDTLFRDVDVDYIEQTQNRTLRSVYFEFSGGLNGVVYSRTGETPEDTASDMRYKYKRINEHWFYWRGTWDD